MGIGEILREAREEQNISIDELQETTKIQKRYLRAIEEGNFHILPGSFYARAFIKEYANAVGLNADDLLEIHEDELPTLGEKRSGVQYTRLQRTRKSSGPSKVSSILSFLPTAIVALLVVGIIALAIYFYKQSLPDPASDNNEPGETDEFYRKKGGSTQLDDINDEDNTTENEEVQEVPDDEVIEELEDELILIDTVPGRNPTSTFDFIQNGEDLVLTFHASGRSWLTVENSDARLYHDFITEDVSPLEIDISDLDEVSFIIGDASIVDIRINDLMIEYPIDRNDFVYQKINITFSQAE